MINNIINDNNDNNDNNVSVRGKLLYSAIILAMAHYIGILLYNPYSPLLVTTYIVGSITSILNHYFNKEEVLHEGFMHLDRIVMIIGFFIDLYFIRIIYLTSKNRQVAKLILILLLVVTSIYFYSLYYKGSLIKHVGYNMHQFIHICVTLVHLVMLKELNMIHTCCPVK
jgi:hypothetical protein